MILSAVPDATPRVLHDLLRDAAERTPNQDLLFVSSSSRNRTVARRTYGWLADSARRLAIALGELNLRRGSVVVVYLSEHKDNMVAIWACLLAGLIPCLQPALSAHENHRLGHIGHIQKLFSQPLWLTSETGAEQLKSSSGSLDVRVLEQLRETMADVICPKEWTSLERGDHASPADEALLFLTSGSTGFSKAAVHTHHTVIEACYAKGDDYRLDTETRTLNWVGFDHVAGSIEMHLAPLLYHAAQVHAHASVIVHDPVFMLKLIDSEAINITFAPNFLFAKITHDVGSKAELTGTFDLSSLIRFNSGGEAVVSKTAIAFYETMKKLSREPSKLAFTVSPGFGMTETCAGCIYGPRLLPEISTEREFMDLGRTIPGCEMRITSIEDPTQVVPDGESGELQVRGPMVFVRYFGNEDATVSSFVAGGWFRTGDAGIIEHGELRLSGRLKDTVIVHGVSFGIAELEAQLQVVEGVSHSFLAIAPYRAPGQDTEGFALFYGPTFSLEGDQAAEKLARTNRALKDVCVRMVTLPPTVIVPIPTSETEKTTLGKLSRARLVAQLKDGTLSKHVKRAETLLLQNEKAKYVAPQPGAERTIANIFASVFELDESAVSADSNFFELGGTSIDVITLKRELENAFDLPEVPIIRLLLHATVKQIAELVAALQFSTEVEYDPVVPLQLTGKKTPIFMVHPGVGEVLIFVNLAKYFANERPFYALRARGFEPGQTFFSSMDEMVTCYAAAVKRTQAHGPYAIAGYSYGGVVAFEVAKRLEALGDEVKFVGLINIPPHIADRMHEIDYTGGMLNLSYFLSLVTKQEAHDLAPRLRPLSRSEQVDFVWKRAPPGRIEELQLTPAKLDHWVSVAGSLIECGKGYDPSSNVSSVDVFYAIPLKGTKEEWLNKQLHPWKQFSRGEPAFIDVPGQHYTLMDLEHVPRFQAIFRSRLESRGL